MGDGLHVQLETGVQSPPQVERRRPAVRARGPGIGPSPASVATCSARRLVPSSFLSPRAPSPPRIPSSLLPPHSACLLLHSIHLCSAAPAPRHRQPAPRRPRKPHPPLRRPADALTCCAATRRRNVAARRPAGRGSRSERRRRWCGARGPGRRRRPASRLRRRRRGPLAWRSGCDWGASWRTASRTRRASSCAATRWGSTRRPPSRPSPTSSRYYDATGGSLRGQIGFVRSPLLDLKAA
jgi:hypothetical protein